MQNSVIYRSEKWGSPKDTNVIGKLLVITERCLGNENMYHSVALQLVVGVAHALRQLNTIRQTRDYTLGSAELPTRKQKPSGWLKNTRPFLPLLTFHPCTLLRKGCSPHLEAPLGAGEQVRAGSQTPPKGSRGAAVTVVNGPERETTRTYGRGLTGQSQSFPSE